VIISTVFRTVIGPILKIYELRGEKMVKQTLYLLIFF